MKVSILSTQLPYEGQIIHGVYSTRAKAMNALKELSPRLLGEYKIREYEVL